MDHFTEAVVADAVTTRLFVVAPTIGTEFESQ
jgi:hypothetical protein